MGSPLPPDPYAALGVAKDATSAAIKTAYRKLALKSHPDKFPDPAQKAEKAAEFHKIQQAYEILGDDDKRERYNAQVRLAELRKEHMERQQARGAATKTAEARPSATAAAANYDIRTPSGTTTYAAPRASRPTTYEEHRSRPAYDDDYEEPPAKPRSTKYVYTTTRTRAASPPRVARGVKMFFGTSSHSRTKTREQEKKRERVEKVIPAYNDSDSDEHLRFEEARKRERVQAHRQAMEEEDRRRRDDEEFRRRAEADRKRDDEFAREREASRRSSSRRPGRESYEKYLDQEQAAREHILKHRGASVPAEDREPVRPAAASRSSSKYVQTRPKKESSKRSSEKSKDRILAGVKYGRGSRDKERTKSSRATAEPEYDDERRRPTLEKADSSPAKMKAAQRSATIDHYPTREDELPSHPRMRRSETMPNPIPSKPAHREEPKANTSKIRTELPKHLNDSGYSSPSTSSSSEKERANKASRKTTTTQYRYAPQAEGGVSVGAHDDIYQTVTVEPRSSSGQSSRKTASRSPVRERTRERDDDDSGREAMASGRTAHAVPNTTHYTYPMETETRRPQMSRTTSTRHAPPAVSRSPPRERDRGYDRGRSRAYVASPDRARGYSHDRDYERPRGGADVLYGEIPKQAGPPAREVPNVVRPTMRRGDSYTKQDVNYGRKYSMADVMFSSRGREKAAAAKHAYAFNGVDVPRPPLQRNHTMAY